MPPASAAPAASPAVGEAPVLPALVSLSAANAAAAVVEACSPPPVDASPPVMLFSILARNAFLIVAFFNIGLFVIAAAAAAPAGVAAAATGAPRSMAAAAMVAVPVQAACVEEGGGFEIELVCNLFCSSVCGIAVGSIFR